MAKRRSNNKKAAEKLPEKSGSTESKSKGRGKGRPFQKGEDSRRNTSGANKGSKWNKTLLKNLLTLELSATEMEMFEELRVRFPKLFEDTEERNFQLFMELKQISLVFSGDDKVAQAAIKEIKDRIEGQSTKVVDSTTEVKFDEETQASWLDMFKKPVE